jgi:hypothetical protein
MEWSVGGAVFIRKTARVAGSVTYSDYKDAQRIVSDSTDLIILPETSFAYPTNRLTDVPQESLVQWRGGFEYFLGSPGNGIVIRTGIFRDKQPYGDATGERVNFKGYTFGGGYVTRSFRIDVAYVSESGDVTFSSNSSDLSNYSNRRWVFSFGFGSP